MLDLSSWSPQRVLHALCLLRTHWGTSLSSRVRSVHVEDPLHVILLLVFFLSSPRTLGHLHFNSMPGTSECLVNTSQLQVLLDLIHNAPRDHVCAGTARSHYFAAGRSVNVVPAVVAVHTTTPGTTPGSRPRSAAAGSHTPGGQGPPGQVQGVAASVRGRVQPVHGRPVGGGAQRLPRHQRNPRQARGSLLRPTTHVSL